MNIDIEVTDTYGGEANYSWVRRYSITLPNGASDLACVRAIKRAADFNGTRCETESTGDGWTLRPRGMCIVIFARVVSAYEMGVREARDDATSHEFIDCNAYDRGRSDERARLGLD